MAVVSLVHSEKLHRENLFQGAMVFKPAKQDFAGLQTDLLLLLSRLGGSHCGGHSKVLDCIPLRLRVSVLAKGLLAPGCVASNDFLMSSSQSSSSFC